MDDGSLVEAVARDFVERQSFLREQADLADAIGDQLSAETWRDILDAAIRLAALI